MREFKKGDKVIIRAEVVDINNKLFDDCSIKVKDLSGDCRYFTKDGKDTKDDKFQTLFHDDSTQERVIEVRNSDDKLWRKRVLAKFLPDGRAVCWMLSETIEGAKNQSETSTWDEWREVQEEKDELLNIEPMESTLSLTSLENRLSDLTSKINEVIAALNKLNKNQ